MKYSVKTTGNIITRNKIGCGFLIFIIVMMGCLIWLIKSAGDELEQKLDAPKAAVGKKVLLGKDTLMIVDYSTIKQSYTLENGKEIAFELYPAVKLD